MRSWASFSSKSLLIPFVGIAFLCGCSLTSPAVGKNALSKPKPPPSPILVFPPEDLSGASIPARDIRVSILKRLKGAEIVITEDEAMEKFMARHRVRYTGGIDLGAARAMKEETGAESVLLTSVGFYSETFPPKIALSSRLVSTRTLEILWIDSVGLNGDDSPGILGLGLVNDPKVLLERATERLMKSLSRHLSGNREGGRARRKGGKNPPETQYRFPALGAGFRPFVLSFSLPESRGERRTGTGGLEVLLKPPSKKGVTVDYGVRGGTAKGAGVEYRLQGDTLIFEPGETKKRIEIEIIDDATGAEEKTIEIGLSNPINAVVGECAKHTYIIPGRGMGRAEDITKKGILPEATFDRAAQAVSESACGVTAKIVLSSVTDRDVSVPFSFGGTARNKVDYRSITESPLMIPSGTQSANIVVALEDNESEAGNRILEVSMGTPINASLGTTRKQAITIKDSGKVRTIAVIPFLNQSPKKNAGEMVALHFLQHLKESSDFLVVEPGEIREKLLDLRLIMEDGISLSNADDLFRKLDADLILTGRVLDYQDAQGGGGKPEVDFSVLVIERKRESVIWHSRSRNRGDDGVFLFDWGEVKSVDRLANRMVESVVQEMLK